MRDPRPHYDAHRGKKRPLRRKSATFQTGRVSSPRVRPGSMTPGLRAGAVPLYRGVVAGAGVTLIAWVMFIFSAMAVACVLAVLLLERRFFAGTGVFHTVLQKVPRAHEFVADNCSAICWCGLCVFALSAIGSAGMIKRRAWGLRMTQALTVTWGAVLLCMALAWLACAMGVAEKEFALGAAGGAGCALAFAALVGAHFFWSSEKVTRQFMRQPRLPQQALISGMVMLNPVDMYAAPAAGGAYSAGVGSKRPPRAKLRSNDQFQRPGSPDQ